MENKELRLTVGICITIECHSFISLQQSVGPSVDCYQGTTVSREEMDAF